MQEAPHQELVQDKFTVAAVDLDPLPKTLNPLSKKRKSHNKQISGKGQLLNNKEGRMKKQEQDVKVKLEHQPRGRQQKRKYILGR